MDNKGKNRKKKIKVILGICIAVFLLLGGGLLVYIHKVDTDTLGRKITIYGLDVSGQRAGQCGRRSVCRASGPYHRQVNRIFGRAATAHLIIRRNSVAAVCPDERQATAGSVGFAVVCFLERDRYI